MKKAMTMLLIILVLVTGIGSTVFAAPADDIMAALESTNAPDKFFPQVESYLNSITITPDQAAAVIAHIEKADEIAAGQTRFSALTRAQEAGIYQEIAAAAKVLNLRTTYDLKTVKVYDASNNVVCMISDADVIKQTGTDYSIVLAGLVLLLLAGAAAVTSRKLHGTRTR